MYCHTRPPEYGDKGPMPSRGEKAEPAEGIDKTRFNGYQERDGRATEGQH